MANDAAIRSDVAGEPASDASPDQAPPTSEVQPDLASPDSAPADTSALDSEESEAGGLDAT